MTPPIPADTEKEPLRPLLARIWRDYLSHHRTPLFLSMFFAAVSGGLAAATLKLLEPAINGLFIRQDAPVSLWGFPVQPGDALVVIPAAIIAVALIQTLASLGQAALVNRLGHGIVGDIQVRLFAAMIRADLARLRSQHSGSFVSSVLFDANLVREAFTNGVVNYTQHSLTLFFVIAAMAF
ncbi:MAG: ABC transporter ATP-binding protein, partial [Alphaproteobacteria bacterium]|nr:ABC transporter ATP-binding protein [Alphaproteobacteria bacterium]